MVGEEVREKESCVVIKQRFIVLGQQTFTGASREQPGTSRVFCLQPDYTCRCFFTKWVWLRSVTSMGSWTSLSHPDVIDSNTPCCQPRPSFLEAIEIEVFMNLVLCPWTLNLSIKLFNIFQFVNLWPDYKWKIEKLQENQGEVKPLKFNKTISSPLMRQAKSRFIVVLPK